MHHASDSRGPRLCERARTLTAFLREGEKVGHFSAGLGTSQARRGGDCWGLARPWPRTEEPLHLTGSRGRRGRASVSVEVTFPRTPEPPRRLRGEGGARRARCLARRGRCSRRSSRRARPFSCAPRGTRRVRMLALRPSVTSVFARGGQRCCAGIFDRRGVVRVAELALRVTTLALPINGFRGSASARALDKRSRTSIEPADLA